MNRYEFEILEYLERQKKTEYSLRNISGDLKISNTLLKNEIDKLEKNKLIEIKEKIISITEKGIESLSPYQVKSAVILAAGFGQRLMPATENLPKPLVKVNGKRIIETLIDALIKQGIEDITIVIGYKKEKFDCLKKKYPKLTFIENSEYDKTNNISSVMLALGKLSGCYLCEADLYISNPDVIKKYQYESNILGSYSEETDDWSFKEEDGFIADYKKGNTYCYNYYGISYWTKKDCKKLKSHYKKVYKEENGKDYFWEFIPLVLYKDEYKVRIRKCEKKDIIEIDNYYELMDIDHSYREIEK